MTQSEYRFEFFAGIAPKVVITEKCSLTIPLLAKIHFREDTLEYENSNAFSENTVQKAVYFGYGFDLGARTYYALNQKWDIYAGITWELVSIQHNTFLYWKTQNSTYTRGYDIMVLFDNGTFELGVRYKL
jgi:hypothetical protein